MVLFQELKELKDLGHFLTFENSQKTTLSENSVIKFKSSEEFRFYASFKIKILKNIKI